MAQCRSRRLCFLQRVRLGSARLCEWGGLSEYGPEQTPLDLTYWRSLPHSLEEEGMDHQTFAELLGNYGEFVGSVAVVVTLVYLSRQIREN
jgi:hypothetical protein